jgi:SAM-dependent methyltransferase
MAHTEIQLSSGVMYRSGKGVGGMWDVIGPLQFDFMVKEGLKPHHNFLDIGCGSLRGGVHFINYLESGHYVGIEKQKYLIDAALEYELPRFGLAEKKITLLNRDDFDSAVLGVQFDYALALSVFTHLPWNSILRCLANVAKVLTKVGKFYATFFEDQEKHFTSEIHHTPGETITYPDRDPYHYRFEVFSQLAGYVDLTVKNIGDFNHPRFQKIMEFQRKF